MSNINSAIWRDMMDYLRRRHAPICRHWFEQLEPLELDSGLLTIHVDNSIQLNYLQRRCLDQFKDAAQAATGALVSVVFVNGDDPATIKKTSASALATVGRKAIGRLDDEIQEHDDDEHDGDELEPAITIAHQGGVPHSGLRSARVIEAQRRQRDLIQDQIVLSPDYSFENFVTGPENQLAHAAAVAVANQPGTAYNPLFIHGGVGLGKTHLLQAICQQFLTQSPQLEICYLSCDSFINQFLESVQSGQMNDFRHRYRHVDVLVIDDIHFLADKERTQEEFFHTFNELYQSNRQIVLSSDSPPSEIPALEERLVSRFNWGLVAPVSKPAYETRMAIVRAKAQLRSLDLSDDVVSYLATKITTNARELEGALINLHGNAALSDVPITLELAKSILGEPNGEGSSSQTTLQQVIDAVTCFYNVKLSDLQSKRRHKSITGPRQVCMWLARKRTRFSLEEIGGYFGGRDHTTVMHSIRIVDQRMNDDSSFAQQVNQLDEKIAQ